MQSSDKKYEILRMLKEKYPDAVSGEELSRRFNISRTAIWKYINSLKSEGYVLEASSRVGYRLIDSSIYNGCEIESRLETDIIGKKVVYFEKIDSTNNYAKKIAMENGQEGLVIVAGSQSQGRGRLGRVWDSPEGSGIYFSVILRPPMPPEDIQVITLAAAVAVSRAIEKATGIKPGIKWPNDLLLDGRKVCGILTEMNSEIDRVNFIVLGIGINYLRQKEDFPGELAKTATSLTAYAAENGLGIKEAGRLLLICDVLTELDHVYRDILAGGTEAILKKWKDYSVTLGREVKVISASGEFHAFAEDITQDGKLVVKCSDGSRRMVQSGEVSIR